MYPVHFKSVVIAAILSSCALYATFDPTTAGPIAVSSKTTESGLKISSGVSATGSSNNMPLSLTATPSPIVSPPASEPVETTPRGRAYLFRGALGQIFSRGMDRLANRIEQSGVTASVNDFTFCTFIAEQAIRDYRQHPAPITIIGHSIGGFCGLKFAEMLQAENIPISLLVTIDPAHINPKVPLNVERYINIFLRHDILGGGDVEPKKDYQGHYASFDLSEHEGILHITIDKIDSVDRQLVTKIRQLAATPVKAEGEGVPIRYVVPADAAIELWDSGMPVYVRSGDTLKTLAAYYHVPLWSLTQINQVSENTPLAARQRIIVPRHLIPLSTGTIESPLKR
jgi:hypothetical protein